jgi:hypothetical protein
VVWAVEKWLQELLGAPFTVLTVTGHRNLLQLHKSIVPEVVRWRLALQPYTFDIHAAVRQAHAEGQLSKLPVNLRQHIRAPRPGRMVVNTI